jgi:hypothetical protein
VLPFPALPKLETGMPGLARLVQGRVIEEASFGRNMGGQFGHFGILCRQAWSRHTLSACVCTPSSAASVGPCFLFKPWHLGFVRWLPWRSPAMLFERETGARRDQAAYVGEERKEEGPCQTQFKMAPRLLGLTVESRFGGASSALLLPPSATPARPATRSLCAEVQMGRSACNHITHRGPDVFRCYHTVQ